MTEQPLNPDPDAAKPGPEASTRRDSEAMLRGKPPQDPLIGTTVDQYSIKRVIGEGGMGVVYEALQQSPRRTVALKMMKRGVTSKSAMRRFEYEAQTLGRLRHDGIAQIYQAGTWDDGTGGRPWFAMEYIQGAKTLTQYCKDKKLGTRERLDIFSKVCAAVQHGHAKGIIHRDLKPGNILVTSSGVPKVIDFGVARSTDSDMAVTTLQTDVGALIGTLQYMSPEQCDADPNDIDTRSDVYALGVVLYELLCDQLPYALRHAAIHEAARIIREEEPTKPSSVDKRLRGDIETITLKALEKDRDRRYQSATALEEDIDRYLAGDPIAAKAPSAIDYLKRFARKHKAAAASIAVVFVVLVGAVIAISVFAAEAQHQRILAVGAKEEAEDKSLQLESRNVALAKMQEQAEEARVAALKEAYYGNIRAAELAYEKMDNSTMEKSLWRAAQAMGSHEPDELPFEWQNLHARSDDALQVTRITLQYLAGNSLPMEFLNRNGSQIVIPTYSPNNVQIYDLPSGKLQLALPTGDSPNISACAFSPDGSRVVASDLDNVHIWNVRTGEQITTIPNGDGLVSRIAFSPDNTRIAFYHSDDDASLRSVAIWDAETGDLIKRLTQEVTGYPLVFSPDSTRLASRSSDVTIRIWDVDSGEEVSSLESGNGSGSMQELAFSPDGLRLAGAGTDSLIRIWDIGSGKILATLSGHERGVACIAFSPDGRLLASGGGDSSVRVWDTHAGTELLTFAGHDNEVKSIAFSNDGTELVSAEYAYLYTRPTHDSQSLVRSPGFETRTWRIEPRQTYSTLSGKPAAPDWFHDVESIAFSPDGALIAGSDWSSAVIYIWDVTTGQLLATFYADVDTSGTHTGGNFDRLAFSPDGAHIAAGWQWKDIYIWDTRTGEQKLKLVGDESDITSLSYNPSGTLLASTSRDGVVMVWDTATGDRVATFRAKDETTQSRLCVAFSPDGTRVLTGHHRFIRSWDVKTGQLLSEWDTPTINDQLLFSPDGKDMVGLPWGQIFDVQTGSPRRRLGDEFYNYWGHDYAFHPDGTRIAKASNSTVSLWDYQRGEMMMEWPKRGRRGGIAFSPDGSRIVVGDVVRDPAATERNGGAASYESLIQVIDTRSLKELVRERQDALQRATRLSPLVESWIEKAGGDSELVVALLEQEVKNRTPEEVTILRNLVLEKLVQRRQAKKAETTESAAP